MTTQAEIDRLIRTQFPASVRQRVVQHLQRYPDSAPDALRVRQAILQLSRGNASDVAYYVQTALRNHRDVLQWAQYPGGEEDYYP